MPECETKYMRSGTAAWRILDGSAVIVTPHDGMIHNLNETGTWIWRQLEEPRTAAEIAAKMSAEFDVPPDTALAHTAEFLRTLSDKEIVTSL